MSTRRYFPYTQGWLKRTHGTGTTAQHTCYIGTPCGSSVAFRFTTKYNSIIGTNNVHLPCIIQRFFWIVTKYMVSQFLTASTVSHRRALRAISLVRQYAAFVARQVNLRFCSLLCGGQQTYWLYIQRASGDPRSII